VGVSALRASIQPPNILEAEEWDRLMLQATFFHGFAVAQGIMVHDMAEVSGPWERWYEEVFARAWHECTSFHHRLAHGLQTEEQER
jgi:hypothetical protein